MGLCSSPPVPVLTSDFSSHSPPPPFCPSADYAKGFGGKFGVETDKVDKSAVGFEYQGKTERHESQKGWYHHTQEWPHCSTQQLFTGNRFVSSNDDLMLIQ